MTSSSSADKSSTGVFLFNTHKNEAKFYSKVAGLGIGSNVTQAFASTRANIRNYSVATIQLYQIYCVPTWVAIYVQSTSDSSTSSGGDIYQSVGLVDARHLDGANVQFEPDLASALRDYQQWVTQQGIGCTTGTPSSGPTIQTVSGKVLRVSSVQQANNTIYYLQIEGQNKLFTANLSLSPKLPLVEPDDTVTGTYTDTGNQVINLKTFDDLSINLGTNPSPTPTPSPSPTATGVIPKPVGRPTLT
jgi:hypothetical protein